MDFLANFMPVGEDHARAHYEDVYHGDALMKPHEASKMHERMFAFLKPLFTVRLTNIIFRTSDCRRCRMGSNERIRVAPPCQWRRALPPFDEGTLSLLLTMSPSLNHGVIFC